MDFSQWEKYIDARLKEEITLAEWGRVFGYSPWHLYKIFRRGADIPIMEYIRIQECCVFAKGCGISLIRGSQRECMAGYYRELGFTEAGRIPGAIIDPWGEHLHHDEILFYKTLIGQ